MFKRSKKKQLSEIKYELFLLRDGLGVQKEHITHLVENYGKKEDFVKIVEDIYNYMIEKVETIEKI